MADHYSRRMHSDSVRLHRRCVVSTRIDRLMFQGSMLQPKRVHEGYLPGVGFGEAAQEAVIEPFVEVEVWFVEVPLSTDIEAT